MGKFTIEYMDTYHHSSTNKDTISFNVYIFLDQQSNLESQTKYYYFSECEFYFNFG